MMVFYNTKNKKYNNTLQNQDSTKNEKTEEEMIFEAPLPVDFTKILEILKNDR